MSILIREFKEADREALQHLYVITRNATFFWNHVELHQTIDFDVHTSGEKILVAIEGIEIIGFASIWEADSFLHNLFVHPTAQRQGVGRALLDSCTKYFSNTPTLKCLKANANAMQFYKSQGWQILREELGPDGPYFLLSA
ncbi:GNAT family N-acetyltransferase [Cupriavidus sp. PET2-C1]